MGFFSKELKIGNGEKYDLNKVSSEGVNKEEAAKDKKKLIKIFQAFDLNGDNSLDAIELARAMDYFNSLDEEGEANSKLSKKELKEGAADLNKQLGLEGKDRIKSRDIKKFIKNIQNTTEGDASISREDLFKYIDDASLSSENIRETQVVDDGNGGKKYVISYDNDTEVTVNNDGSYQLQAKDEEGTISTQYHNKEKQLLKETNVYSNNDTEVTDYDPNQTTPVPLKTISTRNNGTVKSELNYIDGKPANETVTSDGGSTEKTFEYYNDEPYIIQHIQNKGSDEQVMTRYTYPSDGTIKAKVTDKNGVTTQTMDDEYNVTSEFVNLNNGTIIERDFNTDGSRYEVVTDKNNRVTETVYNKQNKRVSQAVFTVGNSYEIKYDGAGNTEGIIVQFNETPAAIAKKFGCSVEELAAVNKGKLHGSGKNAYFNVGDSIKIPGELDADAKALQGRDSREQALAKYKAYQEQKAAELRKKQAADAALEARKGYSRTFTNVTYDTFEQQARALFAREGNNNPSEYELKLRINELKQLNPNIKDGELKNKKINATFNRETYASIGVGQQQREEARLVKKAKNEAATGKNIAADMYESINENAAGVSTAQFKNALAKVNKDNVIGVIEEYDKLSPDESLMEAIMDETGTWLENRRDRQQTIVNALYNRALAAGVDPERAKTMKTELTNAVNNCTASDTATLDGLVRNSVATINAAERVTREERTSKVTDNSQMRTQTIETGNTALGENRQKLQDQLDRDGWCADLYEGLKWCVGSDNLDEKVKADLNKFEGYMNQLQEAHKKGGDAAFDAKFKEIFGVDYDPNLARGYSKLQNDYANAYAMTAGLEGFNKEFSSSINGNESYDTMLQKYGNYLQSASSSINDGVQAAENGIALAMKKDGIDFKNATEAQKQQYLKNILKETQESLNNEIQKYTRGKSLDTMKKDLDQASIAIFGNKGDIVSRVNNYVASQQQGGAYTAMALKVAGAIALGVLTGGAGAAALSASALATTAVGTGIISATVDLTDRASSNNGLQDGEVFNILKNAAIDGATVFVGGKLTKAAMCFKSANAFVQAGGRMLAQTTGDIATGAAAEYLQTGEITIEGVTFQAMFSAAGNLVALKQIHKADNTTPAVTSGGSKKPRPSGDKPKYEIPEGETPFQKATRNPNDPAGIAPQGSVGVIGKEKFDGMVEDVSQQVRTATDGELEEISQRAMALGKREQSRTINHLVEDEQILRQLDDATNLGDLYKLEKKVSSWTDDARRQQEILDKIALKRAELKENGTYTVEQRSIDPQIKADAEAALAQSKKHLDPTQIYAVKQYVETITDPAELTRVVENLKARGMKLKSGRLKAAIDAKYAELNIPKTTVEADTPMTASNETRINEHEIRVTGDAAEIPTGATYNATPEDFARFRPVEAEPANYANVVDGTPAPRQTAPNESYINGHEIRVTGDNTPAANGAVYDATQDFLNPTQVTAQVRTAAVGTPRLDRLTPGSGRLGGQAKAEITAEVTNTANAATTVQELQALKTKVQEKISNPELRTNLEKIIDDAAKKLV